jgi:phosphatidate cytidylyltransferase
VKRVLTAVILIPIVVLALFRAPLWLFTLLVLGVALLAAREYFDIAEKTGFRPMREIAPSMFFMFWIAMFIADKVPQHDAYWDYIRWVFAIVAFFTLLYALFASSLRTQSLSTLLGDVSVSFLALLYIALPLACLVVIRGRGGNDALFLLFLMVLVWCGDIAAYYVGRAIGKHKLAPRISPGKTWEGAIASVIGAIIVGLLLFHYIDPIAGVFRSAHLLAPNEAKTSDPASFTLAPFWFVALFAVCVNVTAQLGDLVESALKRGAGVKDSGNLLPGHGGVLDRIDALLFALPVGLLFYLGWLGNYFKPQGSLK